MTGIDEARVAQRAQRLDELHRARAEAELAEADRLAPGSDAVRWRGQVLADVFVVKGLPGPAEASGSPAVSGLDGDAAEKALVALGYGADDIFYTMSRPEPGMEAQLRTARLRRQIEAVDPRVIIALDAESGEDLAAVAGLSALPFGREARVLGRRLFAVDGLEASLQDEPRKKRVWRQLQAARPGGPIY